MFDVKFSFGKFIINSDEEPWATEGIRFGMFGGPGSGKSFNNALVAEQFLDQGGTVVIFQTRSEFHTLKEKFDVLVVGGFYGKDIDFSPVAPKVYAKAVVEDGISMIFRSRDVKDEEKLINFVCEFLDHVLDLEEEYHRPILIIIEEAHEFTPRTSSGHIAPPWVYSRMRKAFRTASQEGRKLNVIVVASSQRPQEVDFTVRMLANISFYGKFASQDISYIKKECLKPYKERGIEVDANRLLDLRKGEWLVIWGSRVEFTIVTQKRQTRHGADTPKLEYVAPRKEETAKTVDSLSQAIMDAVKQDLAEKDEEAKLKRIIKEKEELLEEKETKIKDLETALTVAGKLKVEMPPSPPHKPVTVTISEGAVVTPSTPIVPSTSPTSNIPHLTVRRNVPDAIRELLKTQYCYERNGLTPDEIMDVLKQEAIPFNRHSVQTWLWVASSRGEVRRTHEGKAYRYWIS